MATARAPRRGESDDDVLTEGESGGNILTEAVVGGVGSAATAEERPSAPSVPTLIYPYPCGSA
jgi:hypothetical protein